MARGRQATKIVIDLSELRDVQALLTKEYENLYKGKGGKTDEAAPPFSLYMANCLVECYRDTYKAELDAITAEVAAAQLRQNEAAAKKKHEEAQAAEEALERTRALIKRLQDEGHEINIEEDDEEPT